MGEFSPHFAKFPVFEGRTSHDSETGHCPVSSQCIPTRVGCQFGGFIPQSTLFLRGVFRMNGGWDYIEIEEVCMCILQCGAPVR